MDQDLALEWEKGAHLAHPQSYNLLLHIRQIMFGSKPIQDSTGPANGRGAKSNNRRSQIQAPNSSQGLNQQKNLVER